LACRLDDNAYVAPDLLFQPIEEPLHTLHPFSKRANRSFNPDLETDLPQEGTAHLAFEPRDRLRLAFIRRHSVITPSPPVVVRV